MLPGLKWLLDLLNGSLLLWPAAIVGTVLALGPVVMFLLGHTRVRQDVSNDPGRAGPRAHDAPFNETRKSFEALGFRPLGTSRATWWFLTPLNWRKRFPEAAYLASPDGRKFVCLYRVVPFEPLRREVSSLNDGAGVMKTKGQSAPEVPAEGNDLYNQILDADPAELVARHDQRVAVFCGQRGLTVKPATLQEVVDADTAFELRMMPRMQVGAMALMPLICFLSGVSMMLRHARPGHPGHSPGFGLLYGSVFYLTLRYVYSPFFTALRIVGQRLLGKR